MLFISNRFDYSNFVYQSKVDILLALFSLRFSSTNRRAGTINNNHKVAIMTTTAVSKCFIPEIFKTRKRKLKAAK